METSIAYLNKVHGDLLDTAARERRGSLEPSRGGRVRGPRGPRSTAVIAAAAAILALAGIVGVIAENGGVGVLERAGSGDDSGGGGAVAAETGSTGASAFDAGSDQSRNGEALRGTAGYLGGSERPAVDETVGQVPSELARVIRTAEISLEIARDSFDAVFGDAVDIAEDNGGFVADSSARERAGDLTLRVPADSFDSTLRALRDLGEVQVQSIRGQDVTAEYVDLDARVRIEKARLDVLLDLMNEATSIEQTLRVRNALDDTQLRIEQIQGQLRLLDDRTSLATIHLDLREEGVQRNTEPESIPSAFERGIDGFFGTIGVIVIGLGYLLPLLAIGLVVWFLSTRLRRRRDAR
jgi:hypothetical protein